MRSEAYVAMMHPGVLAVSMRKYVQAVLLLAHTVPLPLTNDVEHGWKHCDPVRPFKGSAHVLSRR